MGPSIWQLLIVLAIVLLVFGAKRIRNLGGDLGGAIKNFRSAMRDGEQNPKGKDAQAQLDQKEEPLLEGELAGQPAKADAKKAEGKA